MAIFRNFTMPYLPTTERQNYDLRLRCFFVRFGLMLLSGFGGVAASSERSATASLNFGFMAFAKAIGRVPAIQEQRA